MLQQAGNALRTAGESDIAAGVFFREFARLRQEHDEATNRQIRIETMNRR